MRETESDAVRSQMMCALPSVETVMKHNDQIAVLNVKLL